LNMDKFDLYVTPLSDGGPAFPVFPETGGGHASAFQGMTLRDYFAAKALPECIGWGEPDEVCARAYQYADAMLKARNN
jgi:hypothetical protein